MTDFAELEQLLGVTFNDKSILFRALTHRSYFNENPDDSLTDNERLEFLGDALLDFVVAEHLYHRYPELQEGDMTSLRSAVVQERTLADLARSLKLGQYLRLGRGESATGGRDRSPLLCATFEAVCGAVLLDQGLATAKAFVLKFAAPAIAAVMRERLDKDAKSQFQEWAQGRWQITPLYRTVGEHGPDHAKVFTVEVWVGDQVFGRGQGRSKQSAEQAAARAALDYAATLPEPVEAGPESAEPMAEPAGGQPDTGTWSVEGRA
jgi:ribonuclease-3